MDNYRDHPNDFDTPGADENSANDVAAQIGTDERRMHVRAYNYWVSLLDGRDFPSIEDLEPGDVQDFAAHSVLLDFTCGRDNPAIPYLGAAIREECAINDDVRTIADVPSRSLLSRLTDHFMQIIANRAPVGFEAEFENPHGKTICYRGILMPFSSDGDTIDFIYGVINWKHVNGAFADPAHPQPAATLDVEIIDAEEMARETYATEDELLELTDVFETPTTDGIEPAIDAVQRERPELDVPFVDETLDDATEQREDSQPSEAGLATVDEPALDGSSGAAEGAKVHFEWQDGPLSDDAGVPLIELDDDAGLADRLWAARETAESVKAGEGRTRAALYKALSLAYDFAISAEANPGEYAELLEESGVKAQARAPMTPVVKLVFGVDYDKARLTEFAAALSYARRQETEIGGFQALIENRPGGLKGLVSAEREARRPGQKNDSKLDAARARLRSAPTISLSDVPTDEEFAIVVTRRGARGVHEAVAVVGDPALIERAICRAV
ncbi:MAG TPA: hypothetical protein VE968_03815 [Sphingomicrobium sp.]|nr:hypothetical protein [Sphingomicrobium sp.]